MPHQAIFLTFNVSFGALISNFRSVNLRTLKKNAESVKHETKIEEPVVSMSELTASEKMAAGKKKREDRRQRFLNKLDATSAALKEEKKRKLSQGLKSIESLSEALPQASDSLTKPTVAKPAPKVLRNKARRRRAGAELDLFS